MRNSYKFTDIDEDDDDAMDAELRTRRQFMYSAEALLAAEEASQCYVMFPEFKKGLEAIDRIFQLSGRIEIPQGALFIGAPGTSKTTLARYYCSSLPGNELYEEGYGAVFIRLRNRPTSGLVISMLLRAVKYPLVEVRRGRLYTMRDIAFEALQQKGTRVVFVDQAHCIANRHERTRSEMTETAASDTLRELMDETKIGLVMLADESLADLHSVDAALADRISVRMRLTHFNNDNLWIAFLRGFVQTIRGMELTLLASERVAASTFEATQGNRRAFRRLLTEAVLVAADAKDKSLQIDHLRLAYERTRGDAASRGNPYAT